MEEHSGGSNDHRHSLLYNHPFYKRSMSVDDLFLRDFVIVGVPLSKECRRGVLNSGDILVFPLDFHLFSDRVSFNLSL